MSLLKRIESARPGTAGAPVAAPGAPGSNVPAGTRWRAAERRRRRAG